MKKKRMNVVLTILTAVLLCAFAFSVSCGRVTDEADEHYRTLLEEMQEDAD